MLIQFIIEQFFKLSLLGNVIKAWDIGVATMKKGERAILTCAPEYAYGKAGSPPSIPPDSTLKFDVSKCDVNIFYNDI